MDTAELKQLVDDLALAKADREATQKISDQVNKTYQDLKFRTLSALQACELDKFVGDSLTVSVTDKTSVKVPSTPEDRAAFFQYLKDRNIFEDMITVNSQRLNSFFREEEANKLREGVVDFAIPGLNEITTYSELNIRSR